MSSHNGSCLCGAIQITVAGDPEIVVSCHCTDCSKNAGAPYQLSARYSDSQIKITKGESYIGKYVVTKTTSGKEKWKAFSTCCGCTLWTIPQSAGGNKWVVRTAILENGLRDFKPSVEFFTKLRPAFLQPVEGATQIETYPAPSS